MRVRFGEFVLDAGRRELSRDGALLHLPPKAFQLLQILVEHRPAALSQEELHDALWPETFVGPSSLHTLIHQIREALGDSEQAVIRTAYGYGFSFGAAANDDRPGFTRWHIVIGDRRFDLHRGENIVGREPDVAVSIDSPSVSRRHARIVVSPHGVTIEDLGSKNGTTVAGRRLRGIKALNTGDAILFGTIAANVFAVAPAPTTKTDR